MCREIVRGCKCPKGKVREITGGSMSVKLEMSTVYLDPHAELQVYIQQL